MSPKSLKMIPCPFACSRWICGILLLGLLIRLGFAFFMQAHHPDHFTFGDTQKYIFFSDVLFSGSLFSLDERLSPNIAPLYPLLIKLFQTVFSDGYAFALIVLQCFMLTGVTFLLYSIGRKLFNERTALIAASIFSLDYVVLQFSLSVLTETFYLLLLYTALFLGVKMTLKGLKNVEKNGFLFSLALSISALCRATSYYLMIPVLVFFPLCAYLIDRWPARKIAMALLMIFLPWIVITQGWTNVVHAKTGIDKFSASGVYQMFTRRAPDVLAVADDISFKDAQKKLIDHVPAYRHGPLSDKYAQMEQAASQVIKDHPLLYLKRTLAGTARLLLVPGEAEFMKEVLNIEYPFKAGPAGDLTRLSGQEFVQKWITPATFPFLGFFIFSIAILGLAYTGCAAGFVLALQDKERRTAHLFLLGVLIYFILVSSGIESHARYRVPIMPLFYLYASYAASVAIRRFQRGKP